MPLSFEFTEIFVMGTYHSGTNALIQDLYRRLNIPIYPNNGGGFHPNGHWKHSFMGAPKKPGQLVIFMIKDPLFWIKSLTKHQYEIITKSNSSCAINKLLNPLELCGKTFTNILELWNTYASSIIDTCKYPQAQTLIIRYEDFLYHYTETLNIILSLFPDSKVKNRNTQPLTFSSKQHGYRCRNRLEAEAHYLPKNRYKGFSLLQIASMERSLCPDLLHTFGYPRINLERKAEDITYPSEVQQFYAAQVSSTFVRARRSFRLNRVDQLDRLYTIDTSLRRVDT